SAKEGTRRGVVADRAAVRAGGDHASGRGAGRHAGGGGDQHRQPVGGRGVGRGRGAARAGGGGVRPRVGRQDHPVLARGGRGATRRRGGGVRGRRARAGPQLRACAGGGRRRAVGVAARHRRAGGGARGAGGALEFNASVGIEVRREGDVKVGDERVGIRVRVKVTKKEVAPPFRAAEVDIVFGKRIDMLGDLVTVAADLGVITK